MKTLVLGGGHTGLIAGYLTGGKVISNSIRGNLNNEKFPLGPRILEMTKETSSLLKSLDINAEPRVFKVGYIPFGSESPVDEPPVGFKDLYFFKTRGHHSGFSTALSAGKNHITGWDLNEIRLIDILRNRVEVIEGDLNFLSAEAIVYDKNRLLYPADYDLILSTISRFNFYRIYHGCEESQSKLAKLEAYDTTFILVEWPGFDLKDYSYVYCADHRVLYHRVTKIDDRRRVLEVRSDRLGLGIEYSYFPGILGMKTIPNCQIRFNVPVEKIDQYTMLGRYAQWQHGIKIQHVIRGINEIEAEMGKVDRGQDSIM